MKLIKIIAQLNPFSTEKTFFEFESDTVINILKKIDANKAVNTGWRVMLNDQIITDFETVVPEGASLYVKLVPEGDSPGETASKVGVWTGVAAMIAGTVLLFIPGLQLAGGIVLGVGCALFTATGIVYINYQQQNLSDQEKAENDPSIRGSRNQSRPMQTIPTLFGKRRIYPDLIMNPYTEVDSSGNQYLCQLFCAGQRYQQIDIDSIKIEETLLSDYSASKNINKILNGNDDHIKMKVHYGDSSLSYITKCVHEKQFNSILENKLEDDTSGAVIWTTPAGTTEINCDIFFYNGLGKYNDKGEIESTSVEVKAYYKQKDASDSAYQLIGYFNNGSNTISGNQLKTLRYAVSKSGLSADSYTVKIERTTADSESSTIVDSVYLGSIRALKNTSPVRSEILKKLCVIELKVKATPKLQNIIEQLNFVSQAEMPIYSGVGTGKRSWDLNASTSNPASCAIMAMQGEMAQQKLKASDIDWFAFEKLYKWCQSHNYECNYYLTESLTISQLLSNIATCSRSEIFRLNGKITVVQDIERDSPVQLFTPRNSKNYTETLLKTEIPDCLTLKFVNKDSGFAEDEVNVYNTTSGNKETEPEITQEVNLWGVTSSAQARKVGMYDLAVFRARSVVHTFQVDFEYMLCTKGDWIKYAGDIALAGLKQGRIQKLLFDNSNKIVGFVSDELLPMEQANNYAVRIRKNDGEIVLCDLAYFQGNHLEVYFVDSYNADEFQEQNLFAFGIRGQETIDLIVSNITCQDNLTAEITAVEYAPSIFEVDSPNFVLPDFESKISDIPGVVDSGAVDLSDWRTFYTYNDSENLPAKPTGNGTANGWHRNSTSQSKWVSSKTAKDINSGEWSAPSPTSSSIQKEVESLKETVDEMEDINPPSVPGIKNVLVDEKGNVTLTFAPSTDDKSGVLNYIVFRKKENEEWIVIETIPHDKNKKEYAFTDFTEEKNTTFSYAISARDKANNTSSKSEIQTVVTRVTAKPYSPSIFTAIAEKEKIVLSWTNRITADDVLRSNSFEIYISRNNGTSYSLVGKTQRSTFDYTFERNLDLYPESNDLKEYIFKIIPVSLYDIKGDETLSAVNTDKYGTWEVQSPEVTVSGNKRFVSLNLSQPKRSDRKEIYGYISYQILVNRPDLDGEEFFQPATNLDPQADELNYKVESNEPIICSSTYMQEMPLKGQNAKKWKFKYYEKTEDSDKTKKDSVSYLNNIDSVIIPDNAESQYENGNLIFASWSVTTESLTQFYEYTLVDMPSPESTYYRFKIVAQNLITQKIANEIIIGVYAKANSASDLVDKAITQNALADDAVTAEKIAAGTITAEQIAAEDLLVKGAKAGMVSTEGLIVDDSAFLASQPLSYKYTDPVTKEEKHYTATAGEFFVGNSPDVDDNRDAVEFLHYKPGLGFWFKIKNFIIKGLSTIINGVFKVKETGDTEQNSFFVVNATNDIDEETATFCKTVKVKGTVQSKKIVCPSISLKETVSSLSRLYITNKILKKHGDFFIYTESNYVYVCRISSSNLSEYEILYKFLYNDYIYFPFEESFEDFIVDGDIILIVGYFGISNVIKIINGQKKEEWFFEGRRICYISKYHGEYLMGVRVAPNGSTGNQISFFTWDLGNIETSVVFLNETAYDVKDLDSLIIEEYDNKLFVAYSIKTSTSGIVGNYRVDIFDESFKAIFNRATSFLVKAFFYFNNNIYILNNINSGTEVYTLELNPEENYDNSFKYELKAFYENISAEDFIYDEKNNCISAMKEDLIIFDGEKFSNVEFIPELDKQLIAISDSHYLFLNTKTNKYYSVKKDLQFLPIISDEDVTDLNTWSAKKISTALATEKTERQSADTNLQQQIDYVNSKIDPSYLQKDLSNNSQTILQLLPFQVENSILSCEIEGIFRGTYPSASVRIRFCGSYYNGKIGVIYDYVGLRSADIQITPIVIKDAEKANYKTFGLIIKNNIANGNNYLQITSLKQNGLFLNPKSKISTLSIVPTYFKQNGNCIPDTVNGVIYFN